MLFRNIKWLERDWMTWMGLKRIWCIPMICIKLIWRQELPWTPQKSFKQAVARPFDCPRNTVSTAKRSSSNVWAMVFYWCPSKILGKCLKRHWTHLNQDSRLNDNNQNTKFDLRFCRDLARHEHVHLHHQQQATRGTGTFQKLQSRRGWHQQHCRIRVGIRGCKIRIDEESKSAGHVSSTASNSSIWQWVPLVLCRDQSLVRKKWPVYRPHGHFDCRSSAQHWRNAGDKQLKRVFACAKTKAWKLVRGNLDE